MNIIWGILIFVIIQRIGELVYASRNTNWLLSKGAVEAGSSHYYLFPLLHGAWIVTIVLWVYSNNLEAIWSEFFLVYCLLQLLRVWIFISLGRRWTTRIIILPRKPLISSGPYRFLKHPNYVLVWVEVAVFPLIFGAWHIALAFTLLNTLLLMHRIRVENSALKQNL